MTQITHSRPQQAAEERRLIDELHNVLGIVRRGWFYIAVSTLVCLTAALLYAARAKPVFKGFARVLVLQQGGRPIQFSGLAFLNSVPIRLPDTVTVRERVPPGAAALLRNRSHAYADTVLPLSPRELSLVEAIDGQRTVGDLYGAVCASSPDALFLERMWWHDQIVFDASGGR